MALTKKDLRLMISEAVRDTIIKEIKPLIKKTIKQEFYKILEEAETVRPTKPTAKPVIAESDDLSLTQLLDSPLEEDETRQAVQEKIFSGGRGGKFADILNQTATEVSTGQTLTSPGTGGQREIVLNESQPEKAFDSAKLTEQLGYGDGFTKVGAGSRIPGTEARSKGSLDKVSLPTTNPNGSPIDFSKVPVDIVKNMMRDYSGLLKKTDQKVSRTRGN